MTDTPTNAKLDRFMAEKVMGWVIWDGQGSIDTQSYCFRFADDTLIAVLNDGEQFTWRPSADIAQAFECLEKWAKGSRREADITMSGDGWDVVLSDVKLVEAVAWTHGPDLAGAICEAIYVAAPSSRESSGTSLVAWRTEADQAEVLEATAPQGAADLGRLGREAEQ